MERKIEIVNAVRKVGPFLFWSIIVFALSMQYVSLILWYWSYYDLGESIPNRFVAFVGNLPMMIGILSIATPVSNHFFRKVVESKLIKAALIIIVLLIIIASGFMIEVQRTASSVTNLDLLDFLMNYFSGSLWS